MSQPWFKPKRYGYGATPITWKGWVATLVVALGSAALTVFLIAIPAKAGNLSVMNVLGWLLVTAALISAFIVFAIDKTQGKWGWRWGDRE